MLKEKSCTPCKAGAPKLTPAQIADYARQLPDWNVVVEDGVSRFEKSFDFPDFASALDYTMRIGRLAEEEGHHPEILTAWGKVTLHWWTHKIGGLHINDAIMAARSDEEYAR